VTAGNEGIVLRLLSRRARSRADDELRERHHDKRLAKRLNAV
jgi:hypothetical protein